MKLNVEMIEKMIERPVSESEAKTINWLSGWEQETQNNIFMLMMAYGAATYKDGKLKSDKSEVSTREIRDRALMLIGALITDEDDVKRALAVLDGNLDALEKSCK